MCEEHGDVSSLIHATAAREGGATDLETLPFPVAYPLAWAHSPEIAVSDRINNAIFAMYQAMRVTGLVLLADYIASDAIDLSLTNAIRGLRQPFWSDWTRLCDRLVHFWSYRPPENEHPAWPSAFLALVAGWSEVNGARSGLCEPWYSLLQGLDGLQGQARNANDAVWRLRNDRAHRRGTHTPEADEEEERTLARLLPIVDLAAASLFPPESLHLLRRCESREALDQAIRLAGPHLGEVFAPEPVAATWRRFFDTSAIVAVSGAEGRPVYPLFLPLDGPDERPAGDGFVEHAAMMDGVSDRRVVLLGVRGYALRTDMATPVRNALGRKQVDLGLDREQTHRRYVAEYAALTAARALDEVRGSKYLPQCYVERDDVDDAFHRVLFDKSRKHGRAVLVLGEAGSGKSALLARLVTELLKSREAEVDELSARRRLADSPNGAIHLGRYLERRGRGDIVVYLHDRAAYAGDAGASSTLLLCDAVARRAGIRPGEFASLDDLFERLAAGADKRRVWLVLDGLDEAARFADLVTAVDEILPAVARHAWLRLVVAMRTGAWESLCRRHRERHLHGAPGFANGRYLEVFRGRDEDPDGRPHPWLALRAFALHDKTGPLERSEVEAAYELHRDELADRSLQLPWARLRPEVQQLLRLPLRLHLFHETFAGREVPPTGLDEARLFDAFLERQIADLPGLEDTLRDIGHGMYASGRSTIRDAEVDAWLDRWRARQDPVLRIVKLDPIEELVAASILTRSTSGSLGAREVASGFVFTHQRLAEQVLARELRRQVAPRSHPDGADLLRWAHRAAASKESFETLARAVALVAIDLFVTEPGALPSALLDIDDVHILDIIIGGVVLELAGRADAATPVQALLEPLALDATGPRAGRFFAATWRAAHQLREIGGAVVAEVVFGTQVEVLRRAVAADPGDGVLLRDLATALDGLGRLAVSAGRGGEARGHFEEAMELLGSLAREPESDVERDLSAVLLHLGELEQSIGASAAAEMNLRKAIDMLRELVRREPGRADLAHDLLTALIHGSHLEQAAGRAAEARDLLREALDLFAHEPPSPIESDHERPRKIALPDRAEKKPSDLIHRPDPRDVDPRLGGADGYFRKSLDRLRQAIRVAPERVELQRTLSSSLNCLGLVARESRDPEEARLLFEESVEVMRALVRAEPERSDHREGLSISLNNLGRLLRSIGKRDAARTLFMEALEIRRELVTAEPNRTDLRRGLAITVENLGHLARRVGSVEEALARFREALEMRRELVRREPERLDQRRDVSVSLVNLGEYLYRLERDKEASSAFFEAAEIRRGLLDAEPGRMDLRGELAINCWYLYLLSGSKDEEARWLSEAEELVTRVIAADEHDATIAELEIWIRDAWKLVEGAEDGGAPRAKVTVTLAPPKGIQAIAAEAESVAAWRTVLAETRPSGGEIHLDFLPHDAELSLAEAGRVVAEHFVSASTTHVFVHVASEADAEVVLAALSDSGYAAAPQ